MKQPFSFSGIYLIRSAIVLAVALGFGPTGRAATYDWSGVTDGNMTGTPANWGGIEPASADVARWNSSNYTTAPTANANMTVGELLFDTGNTAGVTFGAGNSTLTLNSIAAVGIQVNSGSGAVNTGSAKFALAADQSWLNDSTSLLTIGGTITNSGNATAFTLTSGGSGNTTLSGIISNGGTVGTTALAKSGAGTLTLSAANTYSAGTTISAGSLNITNAGSLGTGAITNNATLSINVGNTTPTGLSAGMSGTGIAKVTLPTGQNTTILNGNYSGFTGTWNVGIGAAAGAGKVQMNGLDNAAATVNILTNATLYISTGGTHNATLTLGGGDTGESLGQLRVDGAPLTWAGPITIAGNVTGSGDYTFGGNAAVLVTGAIGESGGSRSIIKGNTGSYSLSGNNTYSGGTAVNAGTLTYLNTGAKPVAGTTTVAAGATLGLGVSTAGGYFNSADVDALFAGTLTSVTNNATSKVGIDTSAGDFEYASSVGGAPAKGLVKLGANTLTLSGNSTYTGATTVSGGTLAISGSIGNGGGTAVSTGTGTALVISGGNGLTGTSSLTVGSGSTATLASANNFSGATSVTGTLQLQTAGSLAGTSSLTLASGSALQLRNDSPATFSTPTITAPSGSTTIDVNQLSSGSNSTLALGGVLSFTNNATATSTVNVTGANGYTLRVETANISNTLNATSQVKLVFNSTTANVSLGNVTSSSAAGGADTYLVLDGTTTGSVVTGRITDSTGSGWTYVTKQGAGTWVLANTGATNNNSGTTTVASGGGILRIDTAASVTTDTNGKYVLSAGGVATGTLQFNIPGTNTIARNVDTASASLFINGGNAQIENLQGNTTVSGGLTITNTGGTGMNIRATGGNLKLSGTIKNNQSGTRSIDLGGAGFGEVSGLVINGTGTTSIVKDGSGTWYISQTANTFGGPTTIDAGTLRVATLANQGSNSSLGAGGAITVNLYGGTLQFQGSGAQSTNRPYEVGVNGGAIDASGLTATDTLAFSGTFAATELTAVGNLTYTNGSNNVAVGIQNLAVGQTVTAAGLPGGTTIAALNGNGTVTLSNSFNATSGNVSTTFGGPVDRTLTLTGSNAGSNAISSVLADSANLGKLAVSKTGAGKWVLSGNNSFTGPTTVSTGTLLISAGGSLGSGSALAVNGGTFGGNGTVNGTVAVAGGATLQAGLDSGDTATLSLANNLTLSPGSIIAIGLGAAPTTHDILARTGGTWTFDAAQTFGFLDQGAVPGTTYTGIITGLAADPGVGSWSVVNGWTGTFSYNGGNIDFALAAIPEPATWLLVGLGLAITLYRVRRRRADG